MSELKILIEGYAKKNKDDWFASSSTILVKDSGLYILVDPGTNKKLLLESLKREGLKTYDIDIIFLTHYHLDHILNIRLFPDKAIYDGDTINTDDKIVEYSGNIPNTNVKVIETPGHAHELACLLVETKEGKVVIASDLFWWRSGQEQKTDYRSLIDHKDPYVKNEKDLKESREKILEIADWIIPGHGKMFKVNRK